MTEGQKAELLTKEYDHRKVLRWTNLQPKVAAAPEHIRNHRICSIQIVGTFTPGRRVRLFMSNLPDASVAAPVTDAFGVPYLVQAPAFIGLIVPCLWLWPVVEGPDGDGIDILLFQAG